MCAHLYEKKRGEAKRRRKKQRVGRGNKRMRQLEWRVRAEKSQHVCVRGRGRRRDCMCVRG